MSPWLLQVQSIHTYMRKQKLLSGNHIWYLQNNIHKALSHSILNVKAANLSALSRVKAIWLSHYRSDTVNLNTVNSKFHLIRSFCEMFLIIFLLFYV